MIAASDPQEFVPSGRQQALRHPGPLVPPTVSGEFDDNILLSKLENVSITDSNETQNESWILRKTPSDATFTQEKTLRNHWDADSKSYLPPSSNKTHYSDFLEESGMFKSLEANSFNKFGKRVSDASSKFANKRMSVDSDKSECKNSCDSKPASKPYESNLKVKFDPFMEDELYVKGHTVIWSRGVLSSDSLDNGRNTICCYTCNFPVNQALWCTFYRERPAFDSNFNILDSAKSDEPLGTPIESLLICDHHNIKVYTPKGEDFCISVPFNIDKLWETKFGIFIEKQEDDSMQKDSYLERSPSLYSLAHPLDDIRPITVHQSNNLGIFSKPNLKVVFTSVNPSICMVYDCSKKQHSVYLVRKIKADERDFGDKMQSFYSSASTSNKLKSRLNLWDNLMNSRSSPTPSPLSKPASLGNLTHLQQSRSHSSMATISRCQSPCQSSFGSPWPTQNSKLHNSFMRLEKSSMQLSRSYFDCSKTMSHLKSKPAICLDYLWTDSYSVQDSATAGAAAKVFLIDDLIGQWYLCYLLTSRFQLSIVKIDFSESNYVNFGVLTSISAKDAVPIPSLHMLAILEHNGNVTLYSGLTVVGKLHIGGTLAQHTPCPSVRRFIKRFTSPFPRRSSLLPNLKSTDPQFDEHLLSPVLPMPSLMSRNPNVLQLSFQDHENQQVVLNGLTDAVENRITLRYSDGTFYRISLPTLAASPLVESCIVCLRQILTKDVSILLLSKWYATRNVLGTESVTNGQEWSMFTGLLFELLGYDDDQCSEMAKDVPVTPSQNSKKYKRSSAGSDDDFAYLTSSEQCSIDEDLLTTLNLAYVPAIKNKEQRFSCTITSGGFLLPYVRLIHFSLHLLYEDMKLNTLRTEDVPLLMVFLDRLSLDFDLKAYHLHYWKDFPEGAEIEERSKISDQAKRNVVFWPGCSEMPPNIFEHVYELLKGDKPQPYPYLTNVNVRSRDVVQLCGILSQVNSSTSSEVLLDSFITEIPNQSGEIAPSPNDHQHRSVVLDGATVEQLVLLMVDMQITPEYLDSLPVGLLYLFYDALWSCRENPPSDWPAKAYLLLWRGDLAAKAGKAQRREGETSQEVLGMYSATQLRDVIPGIKADCEQTDGMEDVDNNLTQMRFSEDARVNEARKMLQSSRPVPIVLAQRPDVSDHDFIEEQEKHLYGICIRTMALPVGRGMFTLRTATPVITEPFATPPLCLAGKAPPRGTTVDLNHIETPSHMNLWPLFHNGVANGLRITPDAHNIDNTWIIFNKAKSGSDSQMEHAGFLLALGLNGHLKNLALNSTFNYLEKLHEMTSVGVLLGLSAAFRGTSHANLTKILAIHVEALLPPTSMELDIPQNLQVAGLLGVGLVYQGTAHRHMTEVLLSEIGRPPGPEMENSVDRESYSLAAGLALGLVTLEHGGHPAGLSDLNVPDTLHYFMVGGNKRPLTGSQKDKYKTPSFQIREGSSVNLDVTAPGATLALGLMYLGTGNKAVADWMAPPATQYLLDFVRPDFLMLRVLSRSLILWHHVEPSKGWVEGQVPSTILPYCMVKPHHSLDVDYEAMNQAYCNIVSGACFALGLKFAGTADREAFETLLHFCHMFTSLTAKSIAELAGKSTIETCLNVLLLSASMVMAGTGNLEIMRLVRHLRRRVGVSNSPVVTYGSHVAIHAALGLLFLGGGRYTLSNSPASVAALICAFYPKFPTHSNDNRYHLQAFRHLYVLAVEPRLLIPRDVHLDEICYANLKVVKINGVTIDIKGPGIIPDLNTLMRVAVEDERYWPVVFERGCNWDLLIQILSTTGFIEVKQRAGCLSYKIDKFGYHSQLARTLTHSVIFPWDPPASAIVSFTSDESIKLFVEHFLSKTKQDLSPREARMRQMLSKIAYDAVVKDKLIVILVFMSLVKAMLQLDSSPNTNNIWQFKIIIQQILSKSTSSNLISKETILALLQEVTGVLDGWEEELKILLHGFVFNGDLKADIDNVTMKKMASYVIFYDIPYGLDLKTFEGEFLEFFSKLQGRFSDETVQKIIKCL